MIDTPDEHRWRRLFADVSPGSQVVAVCPLAGGVSAETVVMDVISPDGLPARVVGRRHGAADLARNPQIAWDEFRLLNALHAANVPVPRGIGVSDAGLAPSPVLFIEHIAHEEAPAARRHAEEAARLLAMIHQRAPIEELTFLRQIGTNLPPAPDRMDHTLGERRIRSALAAVPPPQPGKRVVLHGDFWPGNLLWNAAGQAMAIDWEDAALGDPLYDLANARLEWRLAFNARSASRFTQIYQQRTDCSLEPLPWWDLRAALKLCGKLGSFGLEPQIERRWRAKHRRFVDEAIAALSTSAQ
jgi:aminoglycoside phosphotransferase (APT) family kinase protein